MTIINHGSWTRYVPENAPAALPSGMSVMFCRRDSDGVDWYDYIYQSGSVFAPGSIKMTVLGGEVQAVVREEDRLFPQSCVLLELTGDDVEVPHRKYGKWLYDEATNTLSPPPVPEPEPPTVDPQNLMAQLTKEDARKIRIAVNNNDDFWLLWSSFQAQRDPMRLTNDRFKAGWAGLVQILGQERMNAIAAALRVTIS